MGELIKFPFGKNDNEKEGGKPFEKPAEEIDFSSLEERTAINMLSRERFDFILDLKRNNPALSHSDAYKNAYDLMVKTSRVEIAGRVNNASEIEIKMKPAYFIAAFNILCE